MTEVPKTVSGVKPPELPEIAIARLELRPGDILVVRFQDRLSHQAMTRIHELFREELKLDDSIRILVLEGGAELSVLTLPQTAREPA